MVSIDKGLALIAIIVMTVRKIRLNHQHARHNAGNTPAGVQWVFECFHHKGDSFMDSDSHIERAIMRVM
jgi:hypothetical protein